MFISILSQAPRMLGDILPHVGGQFKVGKRNVLCNSSLALEIQALLRVTDLIRETGKDEND